MSEWKSEELGEAIAGPKVWKATKLVAPDGTILISIKLFGKKKDGSLYQSKHGFTLPAKDCSKENFDGLVKMLKLAVKASR